jgi:RNA polymerase sigma-70 factor (ECF subfamily)
MLHQHGVDLTDSDDPIDQAILTETTLQVEHALRKLPPAWQEVVRLRIHQNLTFQEIADRLGIPLGTALTRMRRALERLKAEIDHDKI